MTSNAKWKSSTEFSVGLLYQVWTKWSSSLGIYLQTDVTKLTYLINMEVHYPTHTHKFSTATDLHFIATLFKISTLLDTHSYYRGSSYFVHSVDVPYSVWSWWDPCRLHAGGRLPRHSTLSIGTDVSWTPSRESSDYIQPYKTVDYNSTSTATSSLCDMQPISLK
jgi:hypothetical protein